MEVFDQAVREYVDSKINAFDVDLKNLISKYNSEDFAVKVVSLGMLGAGLSLAVASGMDRGTIQTSFDSMLSDVFADAEIGI